MFNIGCRNALRKASTATTKSPELMLDYNNSLTLTPTTPILPNERGYIPVSYTHLDVYKRQVNH